MNWNIFKRIALLEEASAKNIAVIDALNRRSTSLQDQNYAHSKWLTSLENRLQEMGRRLNPYSAAPVRSEGESVYAKAEIDLEKERKRLYHREWRAKNKLNKEARDKKNAYARAYYARTKGKKK
tara:strand:- start:1929 stop:2300 length:372 start_codon:yes stop_codon:yes gene_type:complete